MSEQEQVIEIKILDRSYPVKCPRDEALQLQESANYLDQKMRALKQSASSQNTERLAIVAALNICNELMSFKHQKNQSIDVMSENIKSLQQRIQKFLTTKESLIA